MPTTLKFVIKFIIFTTILNSSAQSEEVIKLKHPTPFEADLFSSVQSEEVIKLKHPTPFEADLFSDESEEVIKLKHPTPLEADLFSPAQSEEVIKLKHPTPFEADLFSDESEEVIKLKHPTKLEADLFTPDIPDIPNIPDIPDIPDIPSPQQLPDFDFEEFPKPAELKSPENGVDRGLAAFPGQFPYQVSIYEGTASGVTFICGGSIHRQQYILTAAQCMFENGVLIPTKTLFVIAGDHTLYEKEDDEQAFGITEVFPHESYDPGTKSNDIALLKLAKPIKPTKFVNSIKLAPEDNISTGSAITSGWGYMESRTLGFSIVTMISDDACGGADYFQNYDYGRLRSLMVCTADVIRVDRDSCPKDAGGPLVCQDLDEPYLCGITTRGYECGDTAFPTIYTDVSAFVPWIQEKTSEDD